MNQIITRLSYILLLFIGFSKSTFAIEQPPELSELIAQERLFISAYLSQSDAVVEKQQVILNIEIATDSWFSKGTLIHHFSVDNTLVLRRNQFAFNSTERRNGRTYSKQLWEVVLYPLEAGNYVIPSFTIDVSVKDGKHSVNGQLHTQPIPLVVKTATSKPDQGDMVISDRVKLTQVWNRVQADSTRTDGSIVVGDVIEREILVRASNTTSSLIPNLMASGENSEQYALYQDSARLNDSHVRGDYIATRREKVVYVFKESGTLTLPTLTLLQWDPLMGNVTEHRLEGETILVSHTLNSYWNQNWPYMVVSTTLALMTVFSAWLGLKRYKHLQEREQLPLVMQFVSAVKAREWGKCERLLYCKQFNKRQKLTLYSSGDENRLVSTLKKRYKRVESGASRIQTALYWLKLWFVI